MTLSSCLCRLPVSWVWQQRPKVLVLAAVLLAVVGCSWLILSPDQFVQPPPHERLAPVLSTGRDHLLIYAFSYSDQEFLENLKYFLQEAVANDVVADYLIIVQEGPTLQVRGQP